MHDDAASRHSWNFSAYGREIHISPPHVSVWEIDPAQKGPKKLDSVELLARKLYRDTCPTIDVKEA